MLALGMPFAKVRTVAEVGARVGFEIRLDRDAVRFRPPADSNAVVGCMVALEFQCAAEPVWIDAFGPVQGDWGLGIAGYGGRVESERVLADRFQKDGLGCLDNLCEGFSFESQNATDCLFRATLQFSQ